MTAEWPRRPLPPPKTKDTPCSLRALEEPRALTCSPRPPRLITLLLRDACGR